MISRPLRFLLGVALAWAVLRAMWLWPRPPERRPSPVIAWAPPLRMVATPDEASGLASRSRAREATPAQARSVTPPKPLAYASPRGPEASLPDVRPSLSAPAGPSAPASPAGIAAAMTSSRAPLERIAISAWALVRPTGSGAGLAPAGQLGASQAGLRATFPIGRSGLAIAARASAPLSMPRGKEAALGIDWRLRPRLPVTLSVERRVGLDRGGRDAWAVGAFGGVSEATLVGRATVDLYAQAGIVGARRRDAFADGAIRVVHPIGGPGFAGVGIWAAAQPGVARVDAGPILGARLGRARLTLEWRARLAGQARPASGPALSLGADF